MKTDYSTIRGLFVENGLDLSQNQYDSLTIYSKFLVEYNEMVNLTAITEPEEIWKKHFLDSIYPLKYLEIPENASLIDVGTGAGFPSVPMAIYRDDLHITLLDSLQKRIIFLEKLCEKIGIRSWQCIHSRAEEAGNLADYREKYDIATARAVAALPVLCEYCMPFVKTGGIFAALKGPNENTSDAVNAITELGGKLEREVSYSICGDERKLVVIRKISHTPTKYPRRSKRILQMPL